MNCFNNCLVGMEYSIRDLLLKFDRLGEWEGPANSDWASRYSEVEATKPKIEAIVGWPLDIDRNVQDASFLTDIGLLDARYYDRKTNTGALYYIFAIRFSNFGHMFTLHGAEWEERYDELQLGTVIKLLESQDFAYIPADQLASLYDGVNEPLSNGFTSWTRFFDYL